MTRSEVLAAKARAKEVDTNRPFEYSEAKLYDARFAARYGTDVPRLAATLLGFAEAAKSYRDSLHTSKCVCDHCELLRKFEGGE